MSGVAEGCVQAGCALIGGETAEHPGTMAPEDYDLAGFSVGIVDKAKVLDHNTMKAGDVILALPSSGIHSNGYSLVRKVFDVEHTDLGMYSAELGQTLGEALLTPTRIYVKPMLRCMEAVRVKASATSPAAAFTRTCPGACRSTSAPKLTRLLSRPLPFPPAPVPGRHPGAGHVQHL